LAKPLQSQYLILQHEKIIGTISTLDYERKINQINAKILAFFYSFDVVTLNEIVKFNRSSNRDYAVQISTLLNDIDYYNNQRIRSTDYDFTHKRYNELKKRCDEAIEKHNDAKNKTTTIDKPKDYKAMVKDLLKNDVPELVDIFLAYRLCVENGFDDALFDVIECQMKDRENDKEIRFILTERIFQFLNVIGQ
jgi:hypothetical protein